MSEWYTGSPQTNRAGSSIVSDGMSISNAGTTVSGGLGIAILSRLGGAGSVIVGGVGTVT